MNLPLLWLPLLFAVGVLSACGGQSSDLGVGDSTSLSSPPPPENINTDPDDTPVVPAEQGPEQVSEQVAEQNPDQDIEQNPDFDLAGSSVPPEAPAADVPSNSASSSANPLVDFGLTERAPLAAYNLPVDGTTLSEYKLVNAYPALRFLEALLVASVPGQNRLVVVEQAGRIKVFDDDPDVTESKVILDISSRIAFSGEQGLLGLAFDPDFEQNGFVYINYTSVDTNLTVVSRLTWDAESDRLDTSREKRILEVPQPYHSHNAGMIAFGPDGFLYVALGDGGDGGDPHNNSQDRSTLLGSVLRIDVHPDNPADNYDIPLNNPFVGEEGVREEIFAFGFRNPFRFSFDRQTGDLWLGDVGQGLIEEINLVTAGGNYGWRVYEGSLLNNDSLNTLDKSEFIPPVIEYTHEKGVAVIGGYVYRGREVRSLVGRYIYTDFTSGTIWALSWDGSSVVANDAIASADGPTSFGEKHDGELLVVSRYGGLFKFASNVPGAQLPTNLSDTGLFTDLATLQPMSGLIEYEPAQAFWSDGVLKRRWIGVPDNSVVEFNDDDWKFPLGTIAVKHFEVALIENAPASIRRLETRVMYSTLQGWQGHTYRWNDAQTDALLVSDRQTETLTINTASGASIEQRYDYPGTADCMRCHTWAAGFVLGVKTFQLNALFDYGDVRANQLQTWNHIGLLDLDIGSVSDFATLPKMDDESASVESRARAYLEVNCSQCHQPSGPASTNLDLRFQRTTQQLNAVYTQPQTGSLGIEDGYIIAPGNKERSVLWQRISSTGQHRMPPLSTHVVDDRAVDIIGQWIDELTP